MNSVLQIVCDKKEKYQGIIRMKKHDQKLLEILDNAITRTII